MAVAVVETVEIAFVEEDNICRRGGMVEVEAEKNGGVRLYARLTPFPFLLSFLDFL